MTVPILELAHRMGSRLKRVTATEWAGPCPVCGGDDRFGVNTTLGVFNCRICGIGGDAITLVRHIKGMSFAEALAFVGDERANESGHSRSIRAHRQVSSGGATNPAHGGLVLENVLQVATREDDAKRISDAIALFRESVDPRGTAAEKYFKSRALDLGDLTGRVIRWNSRIGAMVALFRNIETGKPQSIARTFLDRDGRKLKRKFLGRVGGAAVMLDPFNVITHGLHVGEGVETCQAARQLGLRPTWALGSAGAIAALPVLGGIECLTLLAENDDASARAVETCGSRWHEAGREVLVTRPFKGKDLNDTIRGAA